MTREDFHERQERRRNGLAEAAARAKAESDAAFKRALAEIEHIPPGQPILVGHHSEKRHRAALKRHDRAMRKAIEREKDAQRLACAAESVGTAGISQDDPDAPAALRARIDTLRAKHAAMVRANQAWRRAKKPAADDAAGVARFAELAGVDFATAQAWARDIPTRYSWERQPYPGYSLQNLAANIRRLEGRLVQVERIAEAAEREDEHHEHRGVGIVLAWAANRLRLVFGAKPEEKVRERLKQWGFRWSPDAGAWQRHLGTYRDPLAMARLYVDRVLGGAS